MRRQTKNKYPSADIIEMCTNIGEKHTERACLRMKTHARTLLKGNYIKKNSVRVDCSHSTPPPSNTPPLHPCTGGGPPGQNTSSHTVFSPLSSPQKKTVKLFSPLLPNPQTKKNNNKRNKKKWEQPNLSRFTPPPPGKTVTSLTFLPPPIGRELSAFISAMCCSPFGTPSFSHPPPPHPHRRKEGDAAGATRIQ